MAGPLAAMERFFERIFERPAARLLAPRLEAVHLQRQLERAMESGRDRRAAKWHVQSRYRLLLNPADLIALSGPEALPAELAEGLRDHARRRGYVLAARPSVRLEASPRVAAGDVVVLTEDMVQPAGQPPGVEGAARDGAPGQAGTAEDRPADTAGDGAPGRTDAARAMPARSAGDAPAATASATGDAPASLTSVFRAAQPPAPRATIAVRTPGRDVLHVPVHGATVRVGRASDNDIVLADGRVSRHHGRISARLGTLVYTDLGSTNGSYLQGGRVHEIALGPHDVIQLGGSSLTIEPAAE